MTLIKYAKVCDVDVKHDFVYDNFNSDDVEK